MRNLILSSVIVCLTFCLHPDALAEVDPSLVLYLDFEDGQDEVVKDRSDYANAGIIEGDAKWVDGKFGKGLELDGNCFVLVPDCDEFKITDEVTLASWNRFETVNDRFDFLVCRWAWAAGNNRCYETFLAAGVPGMIISSDGTDAGGSEADAKESVELDKWYHIVGVFDGSEVKIYVDGEEAGSVGNASNIVDGEGPITIGDNNSGIAPDFRFVGVVDEVAVYNRALSQNEIKQKMTSGHAAAVKSERKLATAWGDVKAQY